MKIPLGALARYGIESELDADLDEAVRAALSHYRGKLEAGRPPAGPVSFLGHYEPTDGDTVVDLAVDAETEEVLRREAVAQGVALDRLAAHTVLVYLAELDFLRSPSPAV